MIKTIFFHRVSPKPASSIIVMLISLSRRVKEMIKAIVPAEERAEGSVSAHFGRADYYMLYSIEAGKINEVKVL